MLNPSSPQPQASQAGSASVRFAKRLLAVANPEALASAEAHRDPLAALAFLCPEEGSILEAMGGLRGLVPQDLASPATEVDSAPRVEMLPFKGPKDRKGSSKAYKLLERLSEPLAELQCCSLQGKTHEVRLSFWLNCLNAATLLAALAPKRLGLERPEDPNGWAQLLRTAQLEVMGELLSLSDMEQVIRSQNEVSQQDPLLSTADARLNHLHLKRQAGFSPGTSPWRRSGFPPLRVFQAKQLQAQLELNAVHFLCSTMQLDTWRRKVTLPETVRWHSADLGGESHMMEAISDIFKRAPEQALKLRCCFGAWEDGDLTGLASWGLVVRNTLNDDAFLDLF
eukprot:Skav214824  [mRNA]  locus=scaffold1772:38736:43772:+ [translate_table: standard]